MAQPGTCQVVGIVALALKGGGGRTGRQKRRKATDKRIKGSKCETTTMDRTNSGGEDAHTHKRDRNNN